MLDRVDIVLVRPARPRNVAAACRAMKNMGLRALRIVGPAAGLDDPEARNLAYAAWDVLDAAVAARDLREAVAGASYVAATSARAVAGALTPRDFAALAPSRAGAGRVALVFGPESSGLTEAELLLCHSLVRIPTHAEHSSLNLAQAVLVLAYELFLAAAAPAAAGPAPEIAPAGELESVLDALKEGLLGIGYLNPDNPEAILAELRRLIARSGPSPREISLLRGLARQLGWAARDLRAGGRGRP
jgi:TrmH family RNA methyltransferase